MTPSFYQYTLSIRTEFGKRHADKIAVELVLNEVKTVSSEIDPASTPRVKQTCADSKKPSL